MAVIESIRCHRVSAPLHTPFVTALRTVTTVESLLVEVVDADGASGWGETAQVWKVTGESTAGSQACVEGPIAAALVGHDAADLTAALRTVQDAAVGNTGAKAAVDVALHDLAARRAGLPLHHYLGSTTDRVPTDVTVSAAADPDALAAAARDRVAEGFTVLKLKVGTGNPDSEVARVSAVRAAAGPRVAIRLDANQGWTPRAAVRAIRGFEDAGCDVELVEQPVAGADLDGLAWVSQRVDTAIMADESVHGVRDVVEVIRRRAADLVNVKLVKCGGLAVARTMLELARAHGVGTMVGSMMETQVGVGAAAALVAAHPTTVVSDLDAAWWLERPGAHGGIGYDGASVVLPAGPGLGIDGPEVDGPGIDGPGAGRA